ncbi:uncharacterized protein EV422DRAFT_572255 [Fimicolochytrium jonesii]|uniref:uncharacterized protein n=1 Tax=Fimicolochytrium jonesii TaxID=1396493 RepID=UPI0022FE5E3D|nr:uncharacterized protein EV422DRAFT_572255 [Fimicolochytrium jonesii]KAI8815909.1 hypothetical protein EV422DRAFT_572255 [Fimicolochytrium jonesii]
MKYFAFLIVLMCLLQVVLAEKCACKGGTAHSKRACNSIGATYSHSCGFYGCCVNKGDQEKAFKAACNAFGYGFKQCNECPTC